MAENKKGFVLYADLIHTMQYLTDEQRGLIFLWVLEYVNDMNPEPLSGLLQAVVEPIKQQLKRDLKKYEKRAERSKENGKLGGRPKKPKKPTGLINNLDEPRKPDTVKDTVTVKVKDSNNNNIDYGALLLAFNLLTGKKSRVVNKKTKAQINARFKEGYNKADIWKALQNAVNDPFHKETNLKHITLEFITRADKLDKFISLAEPSTKYNPNL